MEEYSLTMTVSPVLLTWIYVLGGILSYLLIGSVTTGVIFKLSKLGSEDEPLCVLFFALWPVVVIIMPFFYLFRFISGHNK